MSDNCRPCDSLDCVVTSDVRLYSLDGLPFQPPPTVPPVIPPFGNDGGISFCCDFLNFTGTIPGWLTIQGDCMVVTPNSFRGETNAEAGDSAQAALDAFVAESLANGNLVCGAVCAALEDYNSSVNASITIVRSMAFETGGSYLMVAGSAGQDIVFLDAANSYSQDHVVPQAGGFSCQASGYCSALSKFVAVSSSMGVDAVANFVTLPGLTDSSVSVDNVFNAMGSSLMLSLIVNQTTNMAYINGSAKVARIDLDTETMAAYSAAASGGSRFAGQLAVNEVDNKVYAYRLSFFPYTGDDFVDILNGTTLALENSIPISSNANGFAHAGNVVYSPERQRIYVSVEDVNEVCTIYVLNPQTLSVESSILIPEAASWRENAIYDASRLHAIFPFLDAAGTNRGAAVICCADDTLLGIIDTGTSVNNCAVLNTLDNQIVLGMNAAGELRLYD